MTKRKGWLLGLCALLFGWLWWENNALMVSEYTLTASRLPEGFDGYRIAQISDLHNAEFGKNNEKLLTLLDRTEPDIVVLTGDLVDSRRTDISAALSFAQEAVKIAPCYYVTGNHESRIAQLPELLKGLTEAGVTVLRNEAVALEENGQIVTLLGVDDPAFRSDYLRGDSAPVLTAALDGLARETMGCTILLSHRPEWLRLYTGYGLDLVFSGHAHGGQFRLPFVGGIAAPNQGLFPQFDAGVYELENTVMVVSRGLGNSIIPIRINNRPEIVVAELRCQEGVQ